jgi:hypothetical protein
LPVAWAAGIADISSRSAAPADDLFPAPARRKHPIESEYNPMLMKPNRAVIAAAYAVALLLVLVPLSEMTLRVWPLRMGEPSWRFGAVGLFSNALMTPLLGLTFAGMLAFIYGHRRTIRTLSVVLGVAGLLLTIAGGMFILDALQMRASVVPEAKLAFDVASAQALAKIGIFATIGFVMAIGGWRSTTYPASKASSKAPKAGEGIVRKPHELMPAPAAKPGAPALGSTKNA